MLRRIALELPWDGVLACAGAFGVPGAESRLSPQMRRVHQSRCARALAIELLDEQGQRDVADIRKQSADYDREYATFDQETIAAVDKFREEHTLNYQGNPAGLVDERFVSALRAAYLAKRKETAK